MNPVVARCYAFRVLQPFQGVFHCVATERARAITGDGESWMIQVRCRRHPAGRAARNAGATAERFTGYGRWAPGDGLVRRPLDPAVRIEDARAAAMPLLDELPELSAGAPFALRDTQELWLLDQSGGEPLALLASRLGTGPDAVAESAWQPAGHRELRERGGRSPSAFDNSRRELLGRAIAAAAGRPARTAWFERRIDGSGVRRADGAVVEAERFPPLLLRSDWRDAETAELVRAYLAWQAPLLLMLPDLSPAQRAWLETEARHQALVVAAVYRLYPQVQDRERLTAVLVEARLRRAGG